MLHREGTPQSRKSETKEREKIKITHKEPELNALAKAAKAIIGDDKGELYLESLFPNSPNSTVGAYQSGFVGVFKVSRASICVRLTIPLVTGVPFSVYANVYTAEPLPDRDPPRLSAKNGTNPPFPALRAAVPTASAGGGHHLESQ